MLRTDYGCDGYDYYHSAPAKKKEGSNGTLMWNLSWLQGLEHQNEQVEKCLGSGGQYTNGVVTGSFHSEDFKNPVDDRNLSSTFDKLVPSIVDERKLDHNSEAKYEIVIYFSW